MNHYYERDGVTIFHGDAREILSSSEPPTADTIITDPVWPNAKALLPGSDRPVELFAEVARYFPMVSARAIVELGCDSDPRLLLGVPASMPFLRVIWLEYACPTRKGRLLFTGDVGYAFGAYPASAPGRRVLSGRFISTKPDALRVKVTRHREWGRRLNGQHPCPRRYEHVAYMVGKWVEKSVLDPFCGSGTTLLAARHYGYRAIGIEIEESFCEIAAKRLDSTTKPMFPPQMNRPAQLAQYRLAQCA